MIVIVAVAIYGAALGLSTRPAMRAVILAALSVGVVQYLAIWLSGYLLHRQGMEGFAWTLQTYAGAEARDVVPTVSAAAFASAFTAVVAAVAQSGEQRRRNKRLAAIED